MLKEFMSVVKKINDLNFSLEERVEIIQPLLFVFNTIKKKEKKNELANNCKEFCYRSATDNNGHI